MSTETASGQPGPDVWDAQWLSQAYPNLDTAVAVLDHGETESKESLIGNTAMGLAAELATIETGIIDAIREGVDPDEIKELQDRHLQLTNRQQVFTDIYSSIRKRLKDLGEVAKIQPHIYEDVVAVACQETLETIEDWDLDPEQEESLKAMVYEVGMDYRLFELKSHFLTLRNPPVTTVHDFDAMFEGYELPPDDWVDLKLDKEYPILNPNGETARRIISKRKEADVADDDRDEKQSHNHVYNSEREHQDYKLAKGHAEYLKEQMEIIKVMYRFITGGLDEDAKLWFSDKKLEDAKQIGLINISKFEHRFSHGQCDDMKRLVRQLELSYLFDQFNDSQTSDEASQSE
ncbi:MAG: hypothetical protein AAB436_02485 [Patescibacteria group bacterium]